MNQGITYGICLGVGYDNNIVQKLIDSIEYQDHKDMFYEILIIGDYKNDLILTNHSRVIPFDETIRKGWITKKKNILAKEASYHMLCLVHDYYLFADGWTDGLIAYNQHNPDWDVLMNKVYRFEGDRHSDWLVNQKYMDQLIQQHPETQHQLISVAPKEENGARWVCGLPYDVQDLSHIQYISGGYILVKTDVLRAFPFDESLCWGQGAEDILWSETLIDNNIRFNFNPYNSVSVQKPKKWLVYQMPDICVDYLRGMFNNEPIQ
jgi:hypothetical protein